MQTPLPQHEAERLNALRRYSALGMRHEQVFDGLTALAAHLLRVPIAMISFLDGEDEHVRFCHGLNLATSRIPLEHAFYAQMLQAARPLLIPDAQLDARFALNPFVTGEAGLRFYLGVPLITSEGHVIGSISVLDTRERPDITQKQQDVLQELATSVMSLLEEQLEGSTYAHVKQEQALFKSIVEQASDAILVMQVEQDPERLAIRYVNDAFTRDTGYALHEIIGRSPDFLYGEHTSDETLDTLISAIRQGKRARVELCSYHKNGTAQWVEIDLTPVHDAAANLHYWVSTRRDITTRKEQEEQLRAARTELERHVGERTKALQELNQQLEHDALHDALTGLPNRTLFTSRLQHAIDRRRSGEGLPFAVLFLDCDRFKVINDTLGHSVGDGLLVAFSKRLQNLIRPSDTIARLGGDEFTVLLEDLDALETALRVAERLQRAFGAPFYVGPHVLHIGASIGVVVSTEGYTTADDVMRDADIAMYRAKSTGRGRFVQFDVDMREKTVKQMRLESELRSALVRDELEVHFQPIMDVATNRAHGLEALVRWPHPERGMISPADFIPLAEETGLIIELDRWVMFEACRRMIEFAGTYPSARNMSLSVNMSTQQFARTDFLETIELVLHASEFPADKLMIEITESLVMQRSEQVMTNIKGLRRLGVQLHVDDFGTGYSSLSYLQQFAPNTLKIDRAFIAQMLERPESAELVRTIIAMAHNLGMAVVAEGVEQSEQLEPLKANGCEYAQGYYFSRPLDPHGMKAFLAGQEARDTTLAVQGSA